MTCSVCLKDRPDSNRYTGSCKACYMKNWRIVNPEANRRIEKRRKLSPAKRSAEWRKKNPARHKELKRDNYERTKPRFFARNRQRRAVAKAATPSWLTHEQREQIYQIYDSCPKGSHVDHIVPLRGKDVCGLHVPWNLQHLPADENLKKGNKCS